MSEYIRTFVAYGKKQGATKVKKENCNLHHMISADKNMMRRCGKVRLDHCKSRGRPGLQVKGNHITTIDSA